MGFLIDAVAIMVFGFGRKAGAGNDGCTHKIIWLSIFIRMTSKALA
jgi:hypothetical protein